MNLLDLFENTNQPQGVSEGHADQQRKIVKRNGQPVGEVGIDRESSPGVGQYYMKHYASGTDNSGYDSREEALDDLKYIMKQSVYGELQGQGVAEAMKPSDIPPAMRQRLTMRDIEAERPAGAFRFRVTFPDGSHTDFMDFAAARSAADTEKGRISRLGEDRKIASTGRTERVLKQLRAQYPEAANDMEALLLAFRSGQLQDRRDINRLDTELDSEEAAIDRLEAELDRIKKRRMASEGLRDGEYHVAMVTLDDGSVKRVPVTQDEGFRERIQQHFAQQGREVRDIKMDYSVQTEAAKKKPQPTNPELWGRAKSAARSKFDVYPSAYANAWAAKWYKQHGGGWRMGKPKKD